jgi:TonB family protein
MNTSDTSLQANTPRLPLMNRLVLAATQLILVVGSGFAVTAAAQSPPTVFQPPLLPGCALPSPKLIAAAAPVDVELTIVVAPSGSVVSVETQRGSGNPELDAAFVSAARACRFAGVSGARINLEHKLRYRYEGGRPPIGIHACFPAEYPSLARRRGEEGTTKLLFLIPAGDAAPEVKLARPSGSSSLDAGALLVGSGCLANPRVRAELAPGQWYEQSIVWVLR